MQTTEQLTVPQLGQYEIDSTASRVTFRTRHLFGLGPVRGRFSIRSGTVNVAEPTSDSSVHAVIDAASIESGSGQRDAAVRSARLLDIERYPDITFICKGTNTPDLPGTLTVRGVSRPVVLTVESCTVTAGMFTARASARIDRTAFGLTAYRGLAARYLQLIVDVRCVRR
jgi:polyisoprenoid-binding protein YceI